MNPKLVLYFLLYLSLIVNHQTGSPSSKTASQATHKKSDACTLLTSSEIEAVQGERVQAAKPGAQSGGGLVISQCIFRTATPSKSVSVALAAPDTAQSSKISPRDYWRKQFHSGAPQAPEKSGGEDAIGSKSERQEEGTKPRSIKGLGEEAYWISNPVTSVLYVLQGDRFLRISIGGIREEPARLEKSKTLARAALKRM